TDRELLEVESRHFLPSLLSDPGYQITASAPNEQGLPGKSIIRSGVSSGHSGMRRTTLVIPGRVQREPGIHWAARIAVGWIPGSLRFASRPGMTTVRCECVFPRHECIRVLAISLPLLKTKGRRECRARAAPAVSYAKGEGRA